MELSLPRITLQALVAKATKGASCNKMLPITGLLAISADNGVVTVTTSDASNYLYTFRTNVETDEKFYVVTQVETFSKLISRLTCTQVTLSVTDVALVVEGNGTYEIELPLDDEGNPVVFPDPMSKVDLTTFEEVDVSADFINSVLQTASASVADTNEVMCYTGFYIGKSIITTDSLKLCSINRKLFADPVLLAPSTVALFDTLGTEHVKAYKKGNAVIFKSPTATLYSTVMNEIDDFQADEIQRLLATEFNARCTVKKDDVLSTLDRMSLFVLPYDNNIINLTFQQNGINVAAQRLKSAEVIPYVSVATDYAVCRVDIEMLHSLVKAVPGNEVIIEFANEKFLKITPVADTSVTQLLALDDDV